MPWNQLRTFRLSEACQTFTDPTVIGLPTPLRST
jgi:hypothetical protein